jgi:hypothetical protein
MLALRLVLCLRSNEALTMGLLCYKGNNCLEFHFLGTQISILMHMHLHLSLPLDHGIRMAMKKRANLA